jgi:NAD+ synthase (glutamine-hydrolysing)
VKKANLRIALAQINPTVGDLEGNSRKISLYINRAKELGADIISFPELALPGYPPEDLLLKPKFIEDNLKTLKELSHAVNNIVAVFGFVDKNGKYLYNAAAVIYNAKIYGIYHKMFLPNYGVFDEKRYFEPGDKPLLFNLGKFCFAVNICEDIWHEKGPTKIQAKFGAKLILNINASPYYAGRIREREDIVCKQAKTNRVAIAYTNLIGGQDELVFDGQSMVVNSNGRIVKRAKAFQEDLLVTDLEIPEAKRPKTATIIVEQFYPEEKPHLAKKETRVLEPIAEIYQALVLGLRDYVTKNGFQKVVIGLSGGIDSSLVATLAADALGKENVTGLFMPTRHSLQESAAGTRQLAENLGIKLTVISIEQIYNMYLVVLEPHFAGLERNITEENIQARIRGNMLMAFSNKFGWLVLTTGNKSEMSTGYATLYGDMAGGLAVIKDVPKMLVYKLARYRNSLSPVIPEDIITRPPTAELRPNQKDTDSLPPYETLDPILKAYVEEDRELKKITASGFDRETVAKVLRMVDGSEYKRRQSPPGIKITPKAFGRDRRMPITNRYNKG